MFDLLPWRCFSRFFHKFPSDGAHILGLTMMEYGKAMLTRCKNTARACRCREFQNTETQCANVQRRNLREKHDIGYTRHSWTSEHGKTGIRATRTLDFFF